MTSTRKTFVWLLALTILLCGLGSAPETLVLCLADYGHAEIEYSSSAYCESLVVKSAEDTTRVFTISRASIPAGSHCGRCLDIPLGFSGVLEEWKAAVRQSDSKKNASTAAALLAPVRLAAQPSPRNDPRPRSFSAKVPAYLQILHLLI